MATVCGQRMILVGAEGCAEIEGEAWYHQASKEEQAQLFQHIKSTLEHDSRTSSVQDLLVDGTNRQYWLLVIHDGAPEIARAKSEKYVRVLRVHTDWSPDSWERRNTMSLGPGWLGHPGELLHVLRTVGADADEEGRFLIYSEPVVRGLDGDMVVPATAEYSVGGRRANLAALLNSTSYGVRGVTIVS